MRKTGWIILFWGSIWGISEATLGYLNHIVFAFLPGLPGLLMFPIAFAWMKQGYRATGKISSVLWMSCIAASVKLVDLWVPGNALFLIVNPAVSLLLEGLAFACVISIFTNESFHFDWLSCFSMGVLWRACFLLYMLGVAYVGLPAGLVTSGLAVASRFLILESFINAFVMVAIHRWFSFPQQLEIRPHWAYAALLIAIASHLAIAIQIAVAIQIAIAI